MRQKGVSMERTPVGWEKGNGQEVTGGSGTWEAEAGVRNGEPECGGLRD